MTAGLGSRPALLVVGHGTKSAAGCGEFAALVDRVAGRAPHADVVGGFLELAPPPIQDSVRGLVEAGHRRIDVVPLVLVAAGHSKGDIPAALERERLRHPGLSFRYGRPLGPHPDLLAEAERRLSAVVPREQWPQTAVVLVGRGATDPDANAEIAKTARLLQEGRGLGTVETAFISLAEPSVPAGLERARRLGFDRVVVLPWFLFAGVLPDRITAQTAAWAAEHPEVEVLGAGLLGPGDALAGVVLERWAELDGGDLRMNCDSCAYRVALPGFESKVGAPQTPHDHPDDPAAPHGHGHGHGHAHGHAHADAGDAPHDGSAHGPHDDDAHPPRDDDAHPPRDDDAHPPRDDDAHPPQDGSAHGADVSRSAHGADVSRSAHGADVTRSAHGADVTRSAHGADVTRSTHGADVTRAAP